MDKHIDGEKAEVRVCNQHICDRVGLGFYQISAAWRGKLVELMMMDGDTDLANIIITAPPGMYIHAMT